MTQQGDPYSDTSTQSMPTPEPDTPGAATPVRAGPPPAIPPPAAWAPAPAQVVRVEGKRTGLAAIAGVLLVVLGILGGVAGLAVSLIGSAAVTALQDYAEIPDIEGVDAGAVLSGVVAFFGIMIAIYSLVYLIAGIGVLRSRGWGRTLGIIVAVISGLIWLSGITNAGAISNATDGDNSVVSGLIGLAIHAYILVALLMFWRSPAASTTAA